MVQPSTEELYARSLATAKMAMPYRPPHHRKRRIAKKWAKRYAVERPRQIAMVAAMMIPAVRGPLGSWRCPKCARTTGGYQAVARAMFPIQQLPPGALPVYDRDPDVAAVVTVSWDEEFVQSDTGRDALNHDKK